MRTFVVLSILVSGLALIGCSGDSATNDQPKVEGKVDIKDMPAGTSVPGDTRPSPADTGAKTDSDSRG